MKAAHARIDAIELLSKQEWQFDCLFKGRYRQHKNRVGLGPLQARDGKHVVEPHVLIEAICLRHEKSVVRPASNAMPIMGLQIIHHGLRNYRIRGAGKHPDPLMRQVRYGIDGVFRYASIGNFIQLLNIGAAGNWNLGTAAYGGRRIDITLNAAIETACDNSGAFDNRRISDAELNRHESARRQTGRRRLLEGDIEAR